MFTMQSSNLSKLSPEKPSAGLRSMRRRTVFLRLRGRGNTTQKVQRINLPVTDFAGDKTEDKLSPEARV